MAQNIVKSIKSEMVPKQPKTGLDELPEVKRTDRQPKKFNSSKDEKSRTRAGNPQMAINPYGKPKVIESGTKIK